MTALNAPPFITHCSLQPLAGFPAVQLLDARFDVAAFAEPLFSQLGIPEPAHLQQAVRKRRAEYLASRYCLRQALDTFGIPQFLLTNGEDRAPQWPSGVSGSLSHTHQRVCALLTTQSALVGVDCERLMAPELAAEMQSMLISSDERQRLAQCDMPFHTALTTVFSLKESLYKAVYPQVRQFMDFSAAEVVECSADLQQVRLRLTVTCSATMTRGRIFEGRASITPDEVLTWVVG